MNLKSIAQRIARGEFHYVLGRFRTVRVSYSHLRRLEDLISRRPGLDVTAKASLFPDVQVKEAVRAIREEAVCFGLQLPARVVAEIEAFGRSEPLHTRADPNGPTFLYSEVKRGYAADGRPTPLGGIRDPIRCPAVREVVSDPTLRAIVREYLGYEPRHVFTILKWSIEADFTDAERRALRHHVIDYHYDVGGYNFVYANFYIVDTNRYSGAHAMIKRSHNRKPLRMLLGPAVQPANEVRRQFGAENEIVIEGPAGMGFVQDASCFHRATPATRGDRLMLAIRFS